MVYILPISQAELIPEELCEKLFPKRMERAKSFRRREDMLRSIAAGALESFVLGVDESEIRFNEWNKPYVPGCCFSLSHSGLYTILAVSDCEIGADIEKIEQVRDGIAGRVFTENEILWMNEDPEIRFFILWTLKESICKLDGRGMSFPMESFDVLPMTRGESVTIGEKKLFGYSHFFEGCVFSVCSERKTEKKEMKILSADDIKYEKSRLFGSLYG